MRNRNSNLGPAIALAIAAIFAWLIFTQHGGWIFDAIAGGFQGLAE